MEDGQEEKTFTVEMDAAEWDIIRDRTHYSPKQWSVIALTPKGNMVVMRDVAEEMAQSVVRDHNNRLFKRMANKSDLLDRRKVEPAKEEKS